jgi:hypothetical protein
MGGTVATRLCSHFDFLIAQFAVGRRYLVKCSGHLLMLVGKSDKIFPAIFCPKYSLPSPAIQWRALGMPEPGAHPHSSRVPSAPSLNSCPSDLKSKTSGLRH